MESTQTNRQLLNRWKAGETLTADELLGALIYARATGDPVEARLDREERQARIDAIPHEGIRRTFNKVGRDYGLLP